MGKTLEAQVGGKPSEKEGEPTRGLWRKASTDDPREDAWWGRGNLLQPPATCHGRGPGREAGWAASLPYVHNHSPDKGSGLYQGHHRGLFQVVCDVITPACGESPPGTSVFGQRVVLEALAPLHLLGTLISNEGGEQEAKTKVWGECSMKKLL